MSQHIFIEPDIRLANLYYTPPIAIYFHAWVGRPDLFTILQAYTKAARYLNTLVMKEVENNLTINLMKYIFF